jgi:hypothetical protein
MDGLFSVIGRGGLFAAEYLQLRAALFGLLACWPG